MKLALSREELHRYIYLFGLAFMVCCLPLSKYLLSISQFLLAVNWLVEGKFKQRFRLFAMKPEILLFASVFLVYSIGYVFSENRSTGMTIVKYALPLLLIPIVMGTAEPLSRTTVKHLLLLFTGAVTAASVVCLVHFKIHGIPAGGNFRDISVFMPHIRFALEVDFAIFILLYFVFYPGSGLTGDEKYGLFPGLKIKGYEKTLFGAGILYLSGFLFFLRSVTGIVIFIVLGALFVLHTTFLYGSKITRYMAVVAVTGIAFTCAAIILIIWFRNFHAPHPDPASLDKYTLNGNVYSNKTTSGSMENGFYTDIYVCDPELRKEWNKISEYDYDKSDMRGQPVASTLKRYLTSKGLRKDSAAVHQLDRSDIAKIESGLANCNFSDVPDLYQRIYENLWEVNVYYRQGYVRQHSFGQRLVFLRIAATIIQENPLTGVGSGDVCDAMLSRSSAMHLEMGPLWKGKPHDQYVFYMLAFGIPGFLWIVFCWVYPVIVSKTFRYLLFNLFAGIILISMFTLDTIESYDSIEFFAYFYGIFVFGINRHSKTKA